MKKPLKRLFSMFLASAMVCSSLAFSAQSVLAGVSKAKANVDAGVSGVEAEVNANSYGLCDNIQDGVILHCFDWKYNDIKAELANIAAAGFTSVQTSPAQPGCGTDIWWGLYQPLGFYIGTNQLGTKSDLQALCTEADKYGIKVIVDVVANHLAGDHSNIQSDLKDSQYWHPSLGKVNWKDRYQVTHGEIGMPDINSEHSYVQQCVRKYIDELKGVGVDGIRWDAAKHISLPSESCNFWKAVTEGTGLYHYGEILVGPDDRSSGNEGLMIEYTNYMSVTDSNYCKDVRDKINNGQVFSGHANWGARGVAANKLVYWGESHDTWSNNKDWGYTNEMSQNTIDRAYAVAAGRNKITALYFSRPSSKNKDDIKAGQKGSTAFKSTEVAAVNHFHNALVGQKDYYTTGNNCFVIARETGAMVVMASGSNASVSVPNGGSTTAPGTYTDEITGNTWTVTTNTISGKVGSSGIAAVYNANVTKMPSATISKEGGNFSTETLTLTIGLKNATSGTYKIGSGSATTFTGSKTITIGADMSYGDSVTITLTATDGTNNYSKTYTFTKSEKKNNIAYLDKPSGWGTPYCYAYQVIDGVIVENAEWKGVQMTLVSGNIYKCEMPENLTAPNIIFTDGNTQYPGMDEDGLVLNGEMIYQNGQWKTYNPDDPIDPEDPITYYDNGVYFDNSSANWSTVYAYFFSGSGTVGAEWPGTQMKVVDGKIYGLELDANFSATNVVFNNGNNGAQTGNCTFKMNGKYNNSSTEPIEIITPVVKGTVTVKYVDASGNSIADSTTLTGKVGDSYTTSAKTISGYTLKTTPNNAKGTYTKAAITVTYVYEKEADNTPKVNASFASGESFKTETKTITLTLANATKGKYSVDNGPVKEFTGSVDVVLGQGKVADSTVTVKATAIGSTTKEYTFTYNKVFNGTVDEVSTAAGMASVANDVNNASSLSSYYSTNKAGLGGNKTITVDGSISDWDSSMIIAQGTANDDPRVYRPNSMYEVPIDMYTLYAAYDDNNLYLMWEMTNVQDVVAPSDNFPLAQGVLFQTMNVPFFIAIDTRDYSTAIGNNGKLQTTGTIWDSGITFGNAFNRLIAISTNGANGPFVYEGNSSGLNPEEIAARKETGIEFDYGLGILSSKVNGIDKAYGEWNNRVVGDMCNENAAWVDFNTLGHSSSTLDFHYEMAIPYETLGTTAAKVKANGLGVMVVATMGKSGMDCLPYDLSMNDQADLDDAAGSQEFNSFEKSDEDHITASYASVAVKKDGPGPVDPDDPIDPEELELNFGANLSAPQLTGTALTLKGIATGGTAPYTYKFYVDGTLVGTKSGSGETSVSWTPSSAKKSVIKCVVTDSKGTSVTSAKYFTVEGEVEDPVITKPTATVTAGDGKVTVKWNAVSGATKYQVVYYVNSKYTVAVNNYTGTSYTVSGLTNGTKYGFLVRAYGNGAWTSYGTADLKYATPQVSVNITKPTVSVTAGNGQVKVSWNAVSGATKYQVVSYLNSKYSVVVNNYTGTSYTVTGLTNGTKYGFLVRAYGNGAWTSYGTADLKYATPQGSGNVTKPTVVVAATSGKVAVSWNAVSGATKYQVVSYVNSKYTVQVNNYTGTSYTVSGLTNGTKYGFLVRAYGNGAWTSYGTADLVYATPTGSTTVIKPTVVTVAGNKKVAVSWSAVTGATKYQVVSYVNNKYTVQVNNYTSTNYTVTGLTNGTKYGFLVRAYVNGVWTSYSTADLVYATPKAS